MRQKRAEVGPRARGDQGAALVEFALLLPFLAILVCGVIDIGRCYSAWNEAKNAAREGALYGQTFPNQQNDDDGGFCADPNNIEARVRQELGSSDSNAFTITITPTVTTCNSTVNPIQPGAQITVQVSRSMNLLTPLVRNLISNPTITAKVKATVQG